MMVIITLSARVVGMAVIAVECLDDIVLHSREYHSIPLHHPKAMLAAVRALTLCALSNNNHNDGHQDKYYNDAECKPHHRTIILSLSTRQLARSEQRIDSPHTCDHTRRVVALTEIWNHILLLNLVAVGIR